MGIACILNWVVYLIVNGHDRHRISGDLPCSNFESWDHALILETVSINAGCKIEVSISPVDQAFQLTVFIHDNCPTMNVQAWELMLHSSDGKIDKVFNPAGFGRVQAASFLTTFPSMQFTGMLTAEGACAYLGIHDYGAHPKQFWSDGNSTVGVEYMHSGGECGRSSLPFRVRVFDRDCDWMVLTDQYREFAETTAWFLDGVARTASRPEWIGSGSLWVNSHWQELDVLERMGGEPSTVLGRVERLRKLVGLDVPVVLHWYEWDQLGYTDANFTECEGVCGFDSHYPEFFPEREGFTDTIRALAELNVKVVPYINGRIFDIGVKSWNSESEQAACKAESGDLFIEEYGNDVKFSVMCPATQFWQHLLAGVSGKVVTDFNVAGVYIDQIGAADPVACFDPNHIHPPGGGSSWTTGYRALLSQVRSSVGPDKLLVTESNVEQLIGSVDTFLSLPAYSGDLDEIVPAFQYMYSNGLFVSAGAEFFELDVLMDNGEIFVKKLMKQFLFGSQLGWFSIGESSQLPSMQILDALEDTRNEIVLQAMQRLVRLRTEPLVNAVLGRGSIILEADPWTYAWQLEEHILRIQCNPTLKAKSLVVHDTARSLVRILRDMQWIGTNHRSVREGLVSLDIPAYACSVVHSKALADFDNRVVLVTS